MPITVAADPIVPKVDAKIIRSDAELIKDVRDKVGKIEAIKVTRWLTKVSLKDAMDFVNGL